MGEGGGDLGSKISQKKCHVLFDWPLTWKAEVYLFVLKNVGGVAFVDIRLRTGPIDDPLFLDPRSKARWIDSFTKSTLYVNCSKKLGCLKNSFVKETV